MIDYKNQEYINELNGYIEKLKRMSFENPEEAKKIAFESLERTGILDEDGNLKYPYNGMVSSNGDFSRGPRYDFNIDDAQTVLELFEDIDNKSQIKQRKIRK